jgi:parallel beta-helix repeat protein
VLGSKAVGNASGIVLDGITSQRAERNQAEGNFYGITTVGSASVVAQNRAIGNTYGILVQGSGHVVSANITDSNSGSGIYVQGSPNAVEGNRGKDNGRDGIGVESSGNTLRRNVYDTNGGHGICAVAGNTNGGANRGAGNALQPDVDFNCVP